MKNNLSTLLSVLSLLLISSCGSDDSAPLSVANELFFDDTSLVGQHGIAVDRGAAEDHYEYAFAISDGDLNFTNNGGFQFLTSSKFFLAFGAASLGDTQFSTGSFEFLALGADAPNANYFFDATFIDIDNSESFSVTGGTVTISGTSPNWTLGLDITLTDDKKLTGSFVGTFELE